MVGKKVFTVGELNSYIKNLLEGDAKLNNIWIKGEISNFKAHSSGHFYFSLKDGSGSLRCVMFRSRAARVLFVPENGMDLLMRGYVSVYERDGLYQFYVDEMHPAGLGALHAAFEQMKAKLEKEGLFDESLKKPLPFLPGKIGVVTSATGAAWQDIQKVIFRRFPNSTLVLAHAAVQGEKAPGEIVQGIELLNRIPGVEVMIVGRGGGSLEELWAFNTEKVARAIFSSRVPVVSAVGHQVDFTIADFVADRRAPTPSAAAEMCVPVKEDLDRLLGIFHGRLVKAVSSHLAVGRQQVAHLFRRPIFRHPKRMLDGQYQHLDMLEQSLKRNQADWLKDRQHRLALLAEKINMLSPLTALSRGYAICRKTGEEKVITSPGQVETGDSLDILLTRGKLICRVTEKAGGETLV